MARWKPDRRPLPRSLGFREGSPVLDLRHDLYGVVLSVHEQCVVIASGHLLMRCHPEGRFGLVHGPMTREYRTP